MSPIVFVLIVLLASVAAGVLGSLLGLGGGIIVIPVLTIFLGVDIRLAIGASIVSVIATSSGAAAAYVRDHLSNIRVGMFLELATTTGALTGAYVAGILAGRWLYLIFGLVLGYSAFAMFRKRHEEHTPVPYDPWSKRLRLDSTYYDKAVGQRIDYEVTGARSGLALMYIAGGVSGLLGIGSGALKVPAMDLAMRLPIKVSTATSNFMIGVTAAASASVYFARGDIHPLLAAPVAVGVLFGATVGARMMAGLRGPAIRKAFFVVLVIISIEMLFKGASY
ncbi:MAG: sulfite exporter TauE/SafE family protein [Dehalococcoidia bacterium]